MISQNKLTNGAFRVPFWGEAITSTRGLDPLGMQNASIATYGVLLPGLTNLTNRIRYYGYYCWLLEFYARHITSLDVNKFRIFMRRSELMIAYLMSIHNKEVGGIPGSNYVSRNLSEIDLNDLYSVIDLGKGATLEKDKEKYWQYSSGAFGQYYLGVLLQLGLAARQKDADEIYICTEKGRELSSAFEKNIKEFDLSEVWLKNLYLTIYQTGFIKLEEIQKISKAFDMTIIPETSEELSFYQNILLETDSLEILNQKFDKFRYETIYFYLTHLNRIENNKAAFYNEFPKLVYSEQSEQEQKRSTAYYGWFYYELNELAHYACETFLWGVLRFLEKEGRPINIEKVIDEIVDLVPDEMKRIDSFISNIEMILSRISDQLQINTELLLALPEKILVEIKNDNFHKAMALAVLLLLKLHRKHRHQIKDLFSFTKNFEMARDGDVIEVLQYIEDNFSIPLHIFLRKFILRIIIDRHIYVALRKIQSTHKNTLKFHYENNNLFHIETVAPVWTNPRLRNLHQFLKDLHILDHDNSLTATGHRILEGNKEQK